MPSACLRGSRGFLVYVIACGGVYLAPSRATAAFRASALLVFGADLQGNLLLRGETGSLGWQFVLVVAMAITAIVHSF